jgi:WbqC-like protein family
VKKVAIVQSNYIPWKGYFDLINSVDEFILLDEVQFTRRDWRNRNRIKTPEGPVWLTIPVRVKGKYFQKISETEVSDPGWAEHHWKTLTANYGRAPHFSAFCEVLERSYLGCNESHLSLINRRFLDAICQILGIGTRIVDSAAYGLVEGKTERLVSLCTQASADVYVSGPAAKAYIEEEIFRQAGITVEYFDYSDYPEYPQSHPPFEHAVTILDLLFHTGSRATEYMKTFHA